MKPTTIYRRLLLLAAIPALVLAACTQDDALTPGGGDESRTAVTFTAAIQNAATTATRTAPGADGAQTVWTADDRIAVFMLPKGGKIPADTLPAAHNVPYSIDPATGVMTQAVPQVYDPDAGGFAPGDIVPMYYPMTDDEVDFVAYYPYNSSLEVDHPALPDPYILGAALWDQTTPEKQLEGDLLYSDNARGIRHSKDAVSLRFRHLMAKLRLDITLGEGLAGGEVTAVKLSGISGMVDFDVRDGSVDKIYPWTPDAKPISCLKLPSPTAGTGAAATFTALVPPHSGADFAGRQITVTVDGEEYTGPLPDADAYSAGTMYAYPVRVTPRGITIGAPAGEVPWTDAQALPQGYDLTIANETELRRFAEMVNTGEKLPNGTPAAEANVLQTADIVLTQGEWTPIGNSYDTPFLGSYNGDGHTITGLTITTASAPDASNIAFAGLFGTVGNLPTDDEQGAVLTGIHLRKVQIDIPVGSGETWLRIGSIAGIIDNSTLSLCSAEGKVKASSGAEEISAGGIAGYNKYSTISRCRASVETTAASTRTDGFANVGGITGWNTTFSFILSCEAQGGAVTAQANITANAGGIAGKNDFGNLIAFCRTGANTVTAQGAANLNYAGGLVGSNYGYLYSCYSRATATATGGTGNWVGAIVGGNYVSAVVQHCYGTGSTGPGTSGLAADPGLGIYYETSPGSDAIYDVMKGYTGWVESITFEGETAYPRATRHTPATYPAHGITPVRVKWGTEAWQRGTNTSYPEIDMTYGGEDNAVAP